MVHTQQEKILRLLRDTPGLSGDELQRMVRMTATQRKGRLQELRVAGAIEPAGWSTRTRWFLAGTPEHQAAVIRERAYTHGKRDRIKTPPDDDERDAGFRHLWLGVGKWRAETTRAPSSVFDLGAA